MHDAIFIIRSNKYVSYPSERNTWPYMFYIPGHQS